MGSEPTKCAKCGHPQDSYLHTSDVPKPWTHTFKAAAPIQPEPRTGANCPHIEYCGCVTFGEPQERDHLDKFNLDGSPRTGCNCGEPFCGLNPNDAELTEPAIQPEPPVNSFCQSADGKRPCVWCAGLGYDYASRKECGACQGTGRVPATQPESATCLHLYKYETCADCGQDLNGGKIVATPSPEAPMSPAEWLRSEGYSQWPDGCWQREGYEADNLPEVMEGYSNYILGLT